MSDCAPCDQRRAYMSADPEMYRGESTKCEAHRTIDGLNEQVDRAIEVSRELRHKLAAAETDATTCHKKWQDSEAKLAAETGGCSCRYGKGYPIPEVLAETECPKHAEMRAKLANLEKRVSERQDAVSDLQHKLAAETDRCVAVLWKHWTDGCAAQEAAMREGQ